MKLISPPFSPFSIPNAKNSLCLALFVTVVFAANATPGRDSGPNQIATTHAAKNYGNLPMSFEANEGQLQSSTKFFSRGRGYALFLDSIEATMLLSRSADEQGEGWAKRRSEPGKDHAP